MQHREGTFKGFANCNLYCQSWHPDIPSQAIVVLVHGLGGHSGMLQNVVDYLVPQGYEVYAMDLRGHGRSMGQRGYINSWKEFREDLRAFLQHIRAQRARCPFILWGHSLGGTIVLDYALRSPEYLKGVIVTAPALSKINIPLHKLLIGQLLSTFLPQFRLPAGLSKQLAKRDRVALAAYLQDPLRHELGSARLVTEFFSTVDWIHYHASELRVPLLLMHGTADQVTSPAGSSAFFHRVLFPDKAHHEYPGAYHDLYDDLECATVLTDVEVWLDQHLEAAERCQPFGTCMLIHGTVPPQEKHLLGKTIPALLDTACDRHLNAQAFNQWTPTGWLPLSNQALQRQVEALALGLRQIGLNAGDRVAFLVQSNLSFALSDLGCLLAQLVDVPIDLTQTLENIIFMLRHSGATALIVTDVALLEQITDYLVDLADLQHIVVVEVDEHWSEAKAQLAQQLTGQLRHHLPIHTLDEVQAIGEQARFTGQLAMLRSQLQPQDLATIVYLPDADNQLVGVMLTHENLSGNVLATFGELPDLNWGDRESALTFLPLNHIFARQLLYGHIYYGHSIYFSDPRRLIKHLQTVQPSILAVVPLLLEKIYDQIRDRGQKLRAPWSKAAFAWALQMAQRHELGQSTDKVYPVLLKLADQLVLRHWRALFGGRLKYLLCGGAALKAEIANVLTAAGLPILQGYGLTQSAGVICFNRPTDNRATTVGEPIPGVELAIAPDQEVLVRGPYITAGYYNNPAATQALIDEQGWLHTGDFGSMTTDGHLQITGLKKSLFKLSTGKYIAPQPIEARLTASPLVAHMLLTGADRRFCGALIFPNLPLLRSRAQAEGWSLTDAELLKHPCILGWYQAVVDTANCHLPYWSIIKRFRLINAELTVENGFLNDQQQIRRFRLCQRFALDIAVLYDDPIPLPRQRQQKAPAVRAIDTSIPTITCPTPPATACPLEAQSLHPRFTT